LSFLSFRTALGFHVRDGLVCGLPGYEPVQSGRLLPTFRKNILPIFLRYKFWATGDK